MKKYQPYQPSSRQLVYECPAVWAYQSKLECLVKGIPWKEPRSYAEFLEEYRFADCALYDTKSLPKLNQKGELWQQHPKILPGKESPTPERYLPSRTHIHFLTSQLIFYD